MAVRCEEVRLAPYTTLRLGGPARRFVEATTATEIVRTVAAADAEGEPILVLGGGSNLVISEKGFPGTVIHIASRGVEISGGGVVTAQAGEDWDSLVAHCVREELAGIECLSGIPGLVGATPIQNVGAYGQEVAQTIVSAEVLDRRSGEVVEMAAQECAFTYRNSLFKGSDRYVVLSVRFRLEYSGESGPIAYKELAAALGVEIGERVSIAAARDAVLELRRRKGMVLDPDDPDTRSVGSFFTNPILTSAQAAELEARMPGFPRWPAGDGPGDGAGDGAVKVPAAWLIEQAGFAKGHTKGRVRISAKHTLALTNPDGAATADDLLALAREVRDGVAAKFGVRLVNEPVLIGMEL